MLRHYRIPLYFLFIGSLLGVFLRWQFIEPTPGVNYTFALHGHSHIMFLGWVFNVLYIGFVSNYIPEKDHQFFRGLFLILQFLVIGMMISFPLQGYGFYSILFTTLHTIGATLFAVRFFIKTKGITTTPVWHARMALIFFVASAAGPFALGYLMASGMGHSNWYNLSIYFYLHFQYNGFFFFGVLALFFSLLEDKQIRFDVAKAKIAGVTLAVACIPAYLLSTLWTQPGYVIGIIAAMAALAQCVGFAGLLRLLFNSIEGIKMAFTRPSLLLISVALTALALKFILQVISAHPFIAQLAYELRPIVIGYLHLVLVGVISALIFVWYIEHGFINRKLIPPAVVTFLVSLVGMETILVVSPWWTSIAGSSALNAAESCFAFSALLSLSYFTFLLGTHIKRNQ